jgi:hypothetical protein
MKPIPDFPGYFADESGNIFSMKPKGDRRAKPPTEPRRLKPAKNGAGYFHLILMKDDKHFTRTVHRLILETFISPRPKGMECCHNNGMPADNRLENLRWDTPKNNQADRKIHGTEFHPNGEKHGMSKLNELQVRVIRRCAERGMTQMKIAKVFGVTHAAVSLIVRRETWGHI